MQTRTSGKGITFAVHSVDPAKEPLNVFGTELSIKMLIAASESTSPRPLEACSDRDSQCVRAVGYHPLLCAVHMAFSEHRPLVLSPDMIWVAIVQGLAIHIKNNAEKLRDRIVSHKGKKQLEVRRSDITPGSKSNNWPSVVDELAAMLRNELASKYDNLVSDFTTTGDMERVVCEIALLDAFQPYFEYTVTCICGIPEVTLEGEVSDWQRLRQKVEALADYDLDWWLPHLRTIADQFVRAAEGDVDLEHWRNIYKLERAYGAERINGWMVKLIPYLKNHGTGNFSIRNPMLEPGYKEKLYKSAAEMQANFYSTEGAVTTRDVPSGLSQAPFTLNCLIGGAEQKQAMQFVAGFVGIEQDAETLALRPKFGWAVRLGSDTEQLLVDLRTCCELRAPLSADDYDRQVRRLLDSNTSFMSANLADDFLSFYRQCDGLTFKDNGGKSAGSRIRGLAELQLVPGPGGSEELAAVQGISWVRLCDLPDGSYVTYQVSGDHDRNWHACIIPAGGGNGRVIAHTFSALLQFLLDACERPVN